MHKFKHIAAILAMIIAPSAFAGGIGGGGTPPAIQDTIMSINQMLNFQMFRALHEEDQKQLEEQKKADERKANEQGQTPQSDKRD